MRTLSVLSTVTHGLLLARSTAALNNDFSSYPTGSQDCLTKAADSSKCSGSTGQQLNECLCTNKGNFIYATAQCVAKNSPNDLTTVYTTMKANCAGTGVTITVSQDAFMAQAAAATASTTTAGPTSTSSGTTGTSSATSSSTSSSTASPTNPSSSDGLSTGAKIGIGAGIGLGAVALILAGVFIWVYNRRRRNNGSNYIQQTTPPAENYSSSYGQSPHPGSYASTFHQTSPHPLGVELNQMAWQQGADKKFDNVAAGQPLLAELGEGGYQHPPDTHAPAPVELPAASHVPQAPYGHESSHAEQPAPNSNTVRYTSPPQTYSAYSPPYERSHF